MHAEVRGEQRRVEARAKRELLAQHTAGGEARHRPDHELASPADDALVRAVIVRHRDLVAIRREALDRLVRTCGTTAQRGEHDIGHLERAGRQGSHERVRGGLGDHLRDHHAGPFSEAVSRDRVGCDARASERRREQPTEREDPRTAQLEVARCHGPRLRGGDGERDLRGRAANVRGYIVAVDRERRLDARKHERELAARGGEARGCEPEVGSSAPRGAAIEDLVGERDPRRGRIEQREAHRARGDGGAGETVAERFDRGSGQREPRLSERATVPHLPRLPHRGWELARLAGGT